MMYLFGLLSLLQDHSSIHFESKIFKPPTDNFWRKGGLREGPLIGDFVPSLHRYPQISFNPPPFLRTALLCSSCTIVWPIPTTQHIWKPNASFERISESAGLRLERKRLNFNTVFCGVELEELIITVVLDQGKCDNANARM